jgi:hypothetical protein
LLTVVSDPSAGLQLVIDAERRVVFRTRLEALADGSSAAGPFRGASMAGGENVRTEPLGARSVDSVRAEGTRTTVTIETGRVGNDSPIEIVSERWYSPQLQVIVMTKRSTLGSVKRCIA